MTAFFAITLLIILAAISPGPDFVMVTKNSLLYSRKEGLFTALGVSTSLLIHASYCLFGLAIIISKSLLVFSLIKYAGALYLVYIGIKSLLTKKEPELTAVQHSKNNISAYQVFKQGLLCNLLNPKAIMFILAFFTVIISPTTPLWAQIGYGLEISLIHLIWFSLLVLTITHSYIGAALNKVQHYIVKVMGVVLIGFGISIAFIHHHTV